MSSLGDAAGANRERLNEGVTTATNPSSLCLPDRVRERDRERIDKCKELESQRERERKVKDGDQMKRRE